LKKGDEGDRGEVRNPGEKHFFKTEKGCRKGISSRCSSQVLALEPRKNNL